MKKKFRSMGRVAIALVLALSLSLVMAVPVSADPLTDVSATPEDATETAVTTYTIGFTTATTWGVKTVDIAFTGFTGTATLGEVTGIGAGTLTDGDLPDLIYTVDDSELIDAGTPITITFSSVTNPAAEDYVVTVTTNDGTPTVIDTGTADVTITPLPAEFEVVAGANDVVTAGVAFSVEITALKVDETTETGYTGDHMITFLPTTWTGTIPDFEVVTFVAGEGTSTSSFILTDVTEESNTVTATDESSVSGESAAITINLPALDHFTIETTTTSVIAGDVFGSNVTVTAFDSLDNVKTDYVGTVSWTSSDPTATAGAGLPAAEALVLGTCTFDAADFILKTVLLEDGSPIDTTITVTGDGMPADASIEVTPATASQWTVEAAPTSIRADNVNASTITATAYDAYDNVATGYTATVTFTESLGTLSGKDAVFGAVTEGVATATLKSNGVVGTATILVTSGSLSDKTVTVTLVAPDLLAEVWVATDGDNADPGTEAAPFLTITAAIAATAEGGIVNVAAGTYSESVIISVIIDKQLTLKGANYGVSAVTGDRGPESIIDVGASDLVEIGVSGVILDGFMIVGDGSRYRVRAESGSTTDGVQIRNNIIPLVVDGGNGQGIFIWPDSTISNWVISNNTVAADGTAVWFGGAGTNNTISGNLIGDGGISVEGTMENTTIENNTISNTKDGGSGVSLDSAADGVTITGNTFSGTLDNGNGVKLWSPTKVSTFAIHQNNFISDFGTGSAVNNGTDDQVDATDNWWGDASGPEHVLNPDGTGEKATGIVDYSPWLPAPYAEPVDPVAPVTSIDLATGWNLISLPLIPEFPAIGVVLDGVVVVKVAGYSPFQEWKYYDPDPLVPDDLAEMNDGWGYWVDMGTTTATLTVSGYEICAPAPAVPPYYPVVEGWNLIGFKSTTSKSIEDYLGPAITGDTGTLEAIYGYDASTSVYFIPETNLEPGYGYWLAVNASGTIYP